MTTEQLRELFLLARRDPVLCEEMKCYELEIERRQADAEREGDDPDLPPLPPSAARQMVEDLVKRVHGPDHNLQSGLLFMVLRRFAREDLGLWTDLGFDLDLEGSPKEP